MGQEQSQEFADKEKPPMQASGVKHKPSLTPKQKAKIEDIIVVKDVPDASKDNMDSTLKKLKKLRITYPVIKNISGIPIEGLDLIPGLSPDHLTEMLLRYQYHLTECAEAVSFDQNALTKRIKEVDLFTAKVFKECNERHKQMDQILVDMPRFFEVESLISRISTNMEKTTVLLQTLNYYLPESERLTPEELNIQGKVKKADYSIN
eukprot:gene5163-294_t